jgi:hypothetical protein
MLLTDDNVMNGNTKVLFNRLYFVQMTSMSIIIKWTYSCHFLDKMLLPSKANYMSLFLFPLHNPWKCLREHYPHVKRGK